MAQDYYFNAHRPNGGDDKDNSPDKPVRRQGSSQRPPQKRRPQTNPNGARRSAPSQGGKHVQQSARNHNNHQNHNIHNNFSPKRPNKKRPESFLDAIRSLESVKETPKSIVQKVFFGGLFVCAVTLVVLFLAVLFFSINYVNSGELVDLDSEKFAQSQTTFLYAKDSEGKDVEIARLHDDENRIIVSIDQMSPHLKDAFIAMEDKRFEKHHGVDWFRTASAVVVHHGSQGGSTITQQLVKNLTGENSVTLVRKYKEILMALNIEKYNTKDEIIEAYMNTIYLSHGCYGVETASQKYFGKHAKDLNIAESAAIAAITQWPNKYDPINRPESNKERQLRVLEAMLEQKKITQQEYDEAVKYDLLIRGEDGFVDHTKDDNNKQQEEVQSYFVDYVIEDLYKSYEAQGISRENAKKLVYGGGLKVYTTLDPVVQSVIEDIYVNREKIQKDAQSAMAVLDYNGHIVGIVGGAGKKTTAMSFNRAAKPHQPGSSIKPISVYGPAIQNGVAYWSKIYKDSPSRESGEHPERPGSGWPKNEGPITHSNVTLQYGLAKSLNTISVRVLTELSLQKSMDFVKNSAHISTYDEKKDLLYSPLAVGGATRGVSPLELAAAYAMFGNGGYYCEPHSYTKVINGKNEIVFNNEEPKKQQSLSPANATVMNKLLQTVMASGGTGSSYRVDSKYECFGKTGTTTDDKDRWFVGGTPYYVAAVWYGHDTPKQVDYPFSYNPSGTIWDLAMTRIHSKKNLKAAKFEQSPDAVQRSYCTVTGLLAKDGCPKATGWYDSKNLPGYCKGGHSSGSSSSGNEEDKEKTTSSSEEKTTTAPAADDGKKE